MTLFSKILSRTFLYALFMLGVYHLSAQQTPRRGVRVSNKINGFYQYLPTGYNGGGRFPLMIFLHGAGEIGNGVSELPRVLQNGPPKEIANGKLTNYNFIVISPQFSDYPDIPDVAALVDYCLANFNVDETRIYLTGLSMGGGIAWRYASRDLATAKKLAAFVPVCGAQYPFDAAGPRILAAANLPIFATHNNDDDIVPYSNSTTWIQLINQAPAPTPPAQLITNPNNSHGHDAWTATYDPASTLFNGGNIYNWMLSFSRSAASLPVKLSSYNISAIGANVTISWTSSFESNNDHYTIERSTDGINFTRLGDIKATNISSGSEYSFNDPAAPTGNDYYRLSQTDIDGRVTLFDVKKITIGTVVKNARIFPNPVINQLTLEMQNDIRGKLSIQILTASGKLIKTIDFVKRNSSHQQVISLNELTPGYYVIQVKGESYSYSQSFIKK